MKRCEQQKIPSCSVRIIFSNPDPIYCACCCIRPVNQNDPLFFAGELGCEKCVHDHYNREYRGLTTNRNFKESFESFFQSELKERRRIGARLLKQIHHARRTECAKQGRRMGWGQ
jgi:hypothetical protein